MNVPSSGTVLFFFLSCTVKVTCLFGLAWLLAAASRRRSAAFRHWLWLLGILGSLALPFLTLLLPAWHSFFPHVPGGIAVSASPQTLHSIALDVIATSWVSHNVGRAVLLLWAAGFAFVSIRLAAGIARLALACARSRPVLEYGEGWSRAVSEFSSRFQIARSVRVLESASSGLVPLTWGLFRPLVLLPAVAREWPESRRRIVVCHELAHVARNDWIFQILAELVRGCYWFHPLAWKAVRGLREESECACDDAVLNCGFEAAQYANELVDVIRILQRSRQVWSAALAFSRPSNFERRLTSMLNPSNNRNHLPASTKLFAAIPALCLLLPLAAIHLPAQAAFEGFAGTVYDPSGAPVPDATVTMTKTDSSRTEIATSGAEGNFKFRALAPGQYELKVVKPGFAEYKISQVAVQSGQDSVQNVNLKSAVVQETLKIVGEGNAKDAGDKPAPLHVGGEILEPRLLTKIEPVYPKAARAAGIQGTVLMNAIIGKEGNILSLRVMNSDVDPQLASAALKAISQWEYSPVLLNGDPIEVETSIRVDFKLYPKGE